VLLRMIHILGVLKTLLLTMPLYSRHYPLSLSECFVSTYLYNHRE
jgi:hypothetical protein